MKEPSNLPPGVSNRDIEEQCAPGLVELFATSGGSPPLSDDEWIQIEQPDVWAFLDALATWAMERGYKEGQCNAKREIE